MDYHQALMQAENPRQVERLLRKYHQLSRAEAAHTISTLLRMKEKPKPIWQGLKKLISKPC